MKNKSIKLAAIVLSVLTISNDKSNVILNRVTILISSLQQRALFTLLPQNVWRIFQVRGILN